MLNKWWKRLLIAPALMIAFVLAVFAVFERGEPASERYNDESSEAFIYLLDEYMIPVGKELAAAPSCNESNNLADVSEECSGFVRVLGQRNDELTHAAEKFESLGDTAPSDIPPEWKQADYDLAGVLRAMQEGDALLIAGWSENDELQWDLGWQRREDVAQHLTNLSRRLNPRVSP